MTVVELTVSALLFDNDGTISDSTPAVRATILRWCRSQGVDPRVFASSRHGTRTKDLLRQFATTPKRGSEMSDAELDVATEEIERSVIVMAREMRDRSEGSDEGIRMLPGVRNLLAQLRDAQANWGIVTSATRTYACPALETAGVGFEPPDVPFLVTGELVSEGKPHPEPYLTGLEELRKLSPTPIQGSDVLVIEDAPAGMISGRAAGCKVLAVCTGPVPVADVVQAAARVEGTLVVQDLSHDVGLALAPDSVELVNCEGGKIKLRINTLS
ncbi:hypothetical protein JCM1840_007401 [Sporobolomyces johnsonii]